MNLLYLLPGMVGGTETYAAGLLQGLSELDTQDEFVVFLNMEGKDWPIVERSNFSRVVCPVKATNRWQRYLFEQLRFPRLLAQHKIDVVHSLGYVTPFVTPCRSVVSILDIVYDYPGAFPFLKRQLLKALVAVSAHQADHIITISQASRRQIVSRLHVPSDKVTVTLLAAKERKEGKDADWTSFRAKLGIRGNYLLALCSLSPSKNIARLLRAFAQMRAELADTVQLILVGHPPRRGLPLRELTDSLGLNERVVFTGYLSDSDFAQVLRHATVFVFPSLYEGFGIPVLEAMEAGVPVACSRVASLPEVAGNAALFFEPTSVDEMTGVLTLMITDSALRMNLIAEGYKNVRRFSWTDTARKTLQVYRQVASS